MRDSLRTFGPLARQVNPTLLWDSRPATVSATAFTAWVTATGDECPLAAGASAKAAAGARVEAKWAKGGMAVTAASVGWAAVAAERTDEAARSVRRRSSHDPFLVATVKHLQGSASYRTDSAAMICAPRRWTSLLSEQGESPG